MKESKKQQQQQKNKQKNKVCVCRGAAGGGGREEPGGWGGVHEPLSHFELSLSSLHISYPAVLLTTEQLQRNVLLHTTKHKQQLNTSAFDKQSSSGARR